MRSGAEAGDREWDGWMTQWTWVWANSGRYEGQGSLVCCSSPEVHGVANRHNLATEQQQRDYSKKRVGKYKFPVSDIKDKISCISHNKIYIRDFHKTLHDNKLSILNEKE